MSRRCERGALRSAGVFGNLHLVSNVPWPQCFTQHKQCRLGVPVSLFRGAGIALGASFCLFARMLRAAGALCAEVDGLSESPEVAKIDADTGHASVVLHAAMVDLSFSFRPVLCNA